MRTTPDPENDAREVARIVEEARHARELDPRESEPGAGLGFEHVDGDPEGEVEREEATEQIPAFELPREQPRTGGADPERDHAEGRDLVELGRVAADAVPEIHAPG